MAGCGRKPTAPPEQKHGGERPLLVPQGGERPARAEVSLGAGATLTDFYSSLAETFFSPDQSGQFPYQRSTKTRLSTACFFGICSGGRSEDRQLRLACRKDEQLSALHPPRSGWICACLTIPAEEPAHSSQEEASGLLLHTHLSQGR